MQCRNMTALKGPARPWMRGMRVDSPLPAPTASVPSVSPEPAWMTPVAARSTPAGWSRQHGAATAVHSQAGGLVYGPGAAMAPPGKHLRCMSTTMSQPPDYSMLLLSQPSQVEASIDYRPGLLSGQPANQETLSRDGRPACSQAAEPELARRDVVPMSRLLSLDPSALTGQNLMPKLKELGDAIKLVQDIMQGKIDPLERIIFQTREQMQNISSQWTLLQQMAEKQHKMLQTIQENTSSAVTRPAHPPVKDASCQRSPQPSTVGAQPRPWGVRNAVPTSALATSYNATMADAIFDPIEQDEEAWADLFCSQPGVLALPHQSRQQLATRANVDTRNAPDRGAGESEKDRRPSELATDKLQACGAKRGAPRRPLSGGSSSAERHIRVRMQVHRRRLIGKRVSQKAR